MTSTPRSPARRAPAARAAGTPRSSPRGAPCVASHAPSCGPLTPARAAADETLKGVNNPRNRRNRNEIKNPTHQRAHGQHLEIPRRPVGTHGPRVDGAPRPGDRVIPQEGILRCPRSRQRDGIHRLGHLEDAERPLHQGDDPPVVEMGEDYFRGQPAARQVPQRLQERFQPPPVLGRRHPVVPGVGPLPEHQAGVGGRPGSSLRR
jgi:hypothetical protein